MRGPAFARPFSRVLVAWVTREENFDFSSAWGAAAVNGLDTERVCDVLCGVSQTLFAVCHHVGAARDQR